MQYEKQYTLTSSDNNNPIRTGISAICFNLLQIKEV